MPQVVAHRGEFRAEPERVRGMRVAHPVRTRAAQIFRKRRMLAFYGFGGQQKEAPQHTPQTRTADRGVAVGLETDDDRRRRIPAQGYDRQAAFGQIARKRLPGERRQGNARQLLSLARDAQPVIAACIGLDVAERRLSFG